jgi:hypothetical protein
MLCRGNDELNLVADLWENPSHELPGTKTNNNKSISTFEDVKRR